MQIIKLLCGQVVINTNGIIGLGHNNKFLNMISILATSDERFDIIDRF